MTSNWRFVSRLVRVGALQAVPVPEQVVEGLGGGRRIPVRYRVGARQEQGAICRAADGSYRLFLVASVRQQAGVEVGDEFPVEVALDAQGGEPELPDALIEALAGIDGGLEALESRSPADRRQLARWIDQPRSEEARRRRIARATEMVLKPPTRRAAKTGK